MTSTKLLPKSSVINAARVTFLADLLLVPYVFWKVPLDKMWQATLMGAGVTGLVVLLYGFAGRLTPRRHFAIVVGAMLVLLWAIQLTGGISSRLTPLYFILVIAAAELSGYAYGMASAGVAAALELLTLYLDGLHHPDTALLETLYVHLTILALSVLVGLYVWHRKQLLLAQSSAAYALATALHNEETPQRVLQVLGSGVASSMEAEAVVLYTKSESDDPDADPRIIMSEGRWSKSLHEALTSEAINHRLVVDGTTYQLALRRPNNYNANIWKDISLHFAMALKRANKQVTTYAEMKRWLDEAHNAQLETLEALVAMLEARDPFTGGHSRRVAAYAARLAKRLGQAPEVVEEVRKAAILHDIGKIALPDGILLKTGPLSSDEWREVRKHPVIGADLISKVSGLEPLADFVRAHHERWDGKGYPDGLAGEEIPLQSRILAVADSFDAITSTRSYRLAKTPRQACATLREGAGTQWCPTCVEAMLHMISDGYSAMEPPRPAGNPA